MKCLIIDDNPIARSTIQHLAGQVKDLEVEAECENGMEAYNLMREQSFDLLLLDIEMPGMSGIELTRNLGLNRPVIIFTTSKPDYAVEAFELNVADYLVKPITPARFLQAVDRARQMLESTAVSTDINTETFIFVRDNTVIRRIMLEDILYAEAMGDYVKLHVEERFYMVHTTLKSLEDRLPSSLFLRVHRSYMVAIGKIDTIQEGNLLIRGRIVPVADSYRSVLNKRMDIL